MVRRVVIGSMGSQAREGRCDEKIEVVGSVMGGPSLPTTSVVLGYRRGGVPPRHFYLVTDSVRILFMLFLYNSYVE